jgi:hypothetical protein
MTNSPIHSKNQLQQIFQKKRLPLPKYDTIRAGGSDHKPIWRSTVTLHDGTKFQGDLFFTKTEADESAAVIALEYIHSNQMKSTVKTIPSIVTTKELSSSDNNSTPTAVNVKPLSPLVTDLTNRVNNIPVISIDNNPTRKTAILVDVENLPKFIDGIEDRINEFDIYAFIGEHHHSVDREFPDKVIKVISPSTRSDGTDTCMQVYIGMLLAREAYETYLIATRDHYGSALVEMIQAPNLGWINKSAKLVTKPSQIL